jgi:hypothetical protein
LNKSPPDTKAKVKNERTKNVQKLNKERPIVGFGSSLIQLHNKILSTCYELKIVQRHCYQRWRLAAGLAFITSTRATELV